MNISKELKQRVVDFIHAVTPETIKEENVRNELVELLTRKPGRPVGWRKRPRDEDKKVVDNVVNP